MLPAETPVVQTAALVCPSCDYRADSLFDECPRCGVVVAKARVRQPGLYDPVQHARSLAVHEERGALSDAGRRAVGWGAALGLAAFVLPFTRFVFSYLVILIHEAGHTAASWLFGYPAIPAFDFLYGGGVSLRFDRSLALQSVLIAGALVALWLSRHRKPLRAVVAAVSFVYLVAALTPLHEILIVAMGHGAELLAAGFFFYRAFSGRAARDQIERTLYAACAVFVSLDAFFLGYRLISSALFQRQYEQAKGGGHWMDFSRLGDSLGIGLVGIAGLFAIATFLPFTLAWLAFLNRQSVRHRLEALLS